MRRRVIMLLVIMLLPINVLAKSTKSSGSGSSCADASTKCRNQVGIEISASKYNRKTGPAFSDVGDRTITITPKDAGLEYVAYLITVDEGTMDELSFDEKITKKNLTSVDDEMDDVDVKRKKFTGSHSWKLSPGKEAIVVVILKSNSERGECCKYDESSPPKCVEKLTCTAGNFKIAHDDSFKELSLSGNAAFLYVQNPKSTNLVTNVRLGEEVCTLSKAGKHFTDSKLDLTSWGGDLGVWQSDKYYGKFLSDCDQQQVAFNLTAKHIQKITNYLLQIYYYQDRLTRAAPKSIDQINQEITPIKTDIVNKYCNGIEGGCDHIISDDLNKLKNINTSCNANDINDLQREYLYISKIDTITAKLTNGDRWVCKTKCYEHLVVNYSPPQVVKAGLCFQYKVTVKSKTYCGVNVNDNILGMVNKKSKCAPVPICENEENKTQAGPNDEFDSCISKCDGGKYSQGCINECYKKVYSNKKSHTRKTSSNNQLENSTNQLIYKNSNHSSIVSLSSKSSTECDGDGSESDDDCFREYYDESKTANDCKTNDIISYVHNGNQSKLKDCAEFYMRAKLIRPMGTYYFRGGDADDRDWGPINWLPTEGAISGSGSNTESTTDIPMQIGRASPFYFRSITEVESLLKSLVVPSNPTGYWKKYNINNRGIKRQYSTRFKCSETCYYTGCDSSDAMTSKQYVDSLSTDLSNISAALSKCSTTSSCDTTEETANFYIKVNTETEGGNNEIASPSKSGSNTSAIVPDISNTIGRGDSDMFVPTDTDINTTTGILGLCYDPNNKEPHYQTTITFPGSWIDLKTGEVQYTDPNNNEEYRKKKKYYCLPYNAKSVNTEWWNWAVNYNYDPSAKPQNFSPKYNIEAKLGNTTAGFGKYNWNVNFQCFYASYDKTGPTPPGPPPPDPPGIPICYRGNEGTKENCCFEPDCEESTKLKYDLRIVDLTNLFPRKRLRGFNWGSSATLKSSDVNVQNQLATRGYDVDPVVYSNEVMQKGEKIYDEKPDFRFTLNSDNVSALKQEELDFDWGKYSSDEIIPGVRYYRIQDAKITGLVDSFSRNWEPGFNNR